MSFLKRREFINASLTLAATGLVSNAVEPGGAVSRLPQAIPDVAAAGGESAASLYEGRAALEMITAVYASHLSGTRAILFSKDRKHPLETA